jgi:hypothetical protein
MDLVSFKYAIQKAHECQGDNTKHAQLKPITLHIHIPTRRDGILILRGQCHEMDIVFSVF